jgi:hypothetical protein
MGIAFTVSLTLIRRSAPYYPQWVPMADVIFKLFLKFRRYSGTFAVMVIRKNVKSALFNQPQGYVLIIVTMYNKRILKVSDHYYNFPD